MKMVICSVLLALSSTSFAGAVGDRESSPFLDCAGVLNNGETIRLEIRSWSFPFQLTGTVTVADVSEPTRIDYSNQGITTSQSRPLKFIATTNIVRGQIFAGTIKVKSLVNGKVASAVVTCNR